MGLPSPLRRSRVRVHRCEASWAALHCFRDERRVRIHSTRADSSGGDERPDTPAGRETRTPVRDTTAAIRFENAPSRGDTFIKWTGQQAASSPANLRDDTAAHQVDGQQEASSPANLRDDTAPSDLLRAVRRGWCHSLPRRAARQCCWRHLRAAHSPMEARPE